MIEQCDKGQTIYLVRGDGMSSSASVDNGTATRKRAKLQADDQIVTAPLMDPWRAGDCYGSRADAQTEADRRNLAGSVYRAKDTADYWQADVAETMARAEDMLRTALRKAREGGFKVDVSRIKAMIEEVSHG